MVDHLRRLDLTEDVEERRRDQLAQRVQKRLPRVRTLDINRRHNEPHPLPAFDRSHRCVQV